MTDKSSQDRNTRNQNLMANVLAEFTDNSDKLRSIRFQRTSLEGFETQKRSPDCHNETRLNRIASRSDRVTNLRSLTGTVEVERLDKRRLENARRNPAAVAAVVETHTLGSAVVT